MIDKNSETVELAFDELEKVTGGSPVPSPQNGAGVGKPKKEPELPFEAVKAMAQNAMFGFGNGADGGGTKPA